MQEKEYIFTPEEPHFTSLSLVLPTLRMFDTKVIG